MRHRRRHSRILVQRRWFLEPKSLCSHPGHCGVYYYVCAYVSPKRREYTRYKAINKQLLIRNGDLQKYALWLHLCALRDKL